MIERQCEVCGAPMILKRPNSSRKYCDACAKKVRMENQKIAQEQLKLKRKAEKIRERDKLGSFLRELMNITTSAESAENAQSVMENMWRFVEGLSDV